MGYIFFMHNTTSFFFFTFDYGVKFVQDIFFSVHENQQTKGKYHRLFINTHTNVLLLVVRALKTQRRNRALHPQNDYIFQEKKSTCH